MKKILALAAAGLFAFSASAFAGPNCDNYTQTVETQSTITTAEAPTQTPEPTGTGG